MPFLIIDSQDYQYHDSFEFLITDRNSKTNVKSIYKRGVLVPDQLKEVYKETKILLILSLVDETFCRVAYEGMMNKLPILSTTHGNLKYLLEGYADFLDEEPISWAESINRIYFDDLYIQAMQQRSPTIVHIVNQKCQITKFISKQKKYWHFMSMGRSRIRYPSS